MFARTAKVLSYSPIIGPPAPSFHHAHETKPHEQDSKPADQQGIQKIPEHLIHPPAVTRFVLHGFTETWRTLKRLAIRHNATAFQHSGRRAAGALAKGVAGRDGQQKGLYSVMMDRQTRELSLLCIIAATSGMLAWALDRPLTTAAFAAAATFMAICVVSIVGQSK
jgi:hypothetical protein